MVEASWWSRELSCERTFLEHLPHFSELPRHDYRPAMLRLSSRVGDKSFNNLRHDMHGIQGKRIYHVEFVAWQF